MLKKQPVPYLFASGENRLRLSLSGDLRVEASSRDSGIKSSVFSQLTRHLQIAQSR